MYKRFFGLEEAPFNLTPDPRFLFMSQRHREAIAALMFGINERKGFIALTGEIGSGKTTICRALMNELTAATKVALILNPSLSETELLQSINEEFGIKNSTDSKKDLLAELNRFLLQQRALGHTVLLIIDESQNLSPGVLEQIRMISNLETETDKLIQIVLMGQPELRETLALPQLEQLNQRITVKYHITPMTEEETAQYIRHRMFVAKAKMDIKLDTGALRMVFDHTFGIPRRINVLMDRILLCAFVEGTFEVDDVIVKRALAEVRGQEGFGGGRGSQKKTKAPRRRWVRATLATAASVILLAAAAIVALQLFNGPGGLPFAFAGRASDNPGPIPRGTAGDPGQSQGSTSWTDESSFTVVTTESLDRPLRGRGHGGAPVSSWSYDQSNIVRVADEREAWRASLVTLMSVVSMQQFELDAMRGTDENTRQALVEAIFDGLAADGWHQVRLGGSLATLLRYDIPMILSLSEDSTEMGPFAVLIGTHPVDGEEMLVLLDPIHGLTEISRVQLGPVYQGQATALYRDTVGLDELVLDEQSDRVRALQRVLTQTGHYAGTLDGAYGPAMREAVRDFQRDERLEPTGIIDPSTAFHLALLLPEEEPGEEMVQ